MRLSQTLIYVATLFILTTACKRHKLIKKEVVLGENAVENNKIDTVSAQKVMPETKAPKTFFNTEQIDFHQIKIKSKIDIKSQNINQTIPAAIHVRKDSTIWVSVALGIEAARASITPDSLFLLDRLNRKYYKLSFVELSEKFNFPINYEMMQSLMVGNLPVKLNANDLFFINHDFNSITQTRNTVDILNKFDLIYKKLYSISAVDNKNGTKFNVNYKSFTTADGNLVPRIITVQINNEISGLDVNIEIEHLKFDFLDRNIRFPFTIPKGYNEGTLPNF